MKTKEQIKEFTDFLPIGMIVQVPKDFFSKNFLELNGQMVHKDDYPKLSEVLIGTMFDQSKTHLVMIDGKILGYQFNENIKAVIRCS